MTETGRWGSRPSPHGSRFAVDLNELHERALFMGGSGGDGPLRKAAAGVARFFSRARARKAGTPAMAADGFAYDPPVSEPQRRAMWAAKEGRSTLGIPREVGAEFVGKGRHGGRASDKVGARDASSWNYRDVIDMAAEYGARKAKWRPGSPLFELWADRIMNLPNVRGGEAALKQAIADADRHAG